MNMTKNIEAIINELAESRKNISNEVQIKVDAICQNAAKASSKVVTEMKELAKSLGDTAEMAAAWNVAAWAILKDSEKNKKDAGVCHGFARMIERKLGTEETDPDKRIIRDLVFANFGALWMKELIATLWVCNRSKLNCLEDIVIKMSVDTVILRDELPGKRMIGALASYGQSCISKFIDVIIKNGEGKKLLKLDYSFWKIIASDLASLVKNDGDIVRWVARNIPFFSGYGWARMLDEADIAKRIMEVDPKLAHPCLELVAGIKIEEKYFGLVCKLLDQLSPIVRDQNISVSSIKIDSYDLVFYDKTLAEVRSEGLESSIDHLLDFEILEVLLSNGITFEYRKNNLDHVYINERLLVGQSGRMSADLKLVSKHPIFGLLLECIKVSNLKLDHLNNLLKIPGLQKTFRFLDGQAKPMTLTGDKLVDVYIHRRNKILFENSAYIVRILVEQGTIGGLEQIMEDLIKMAQSDKIPYFSVTCKNIMSLDSVKLFHGQLRAGLLDEYGDLRLEALKDKLGLTDKPGVKVHFDNLYIIIIDKDRVVVEGPEGIILDKKSDKIKDLHWRSSYHYEDNDVLRILSKLICLMI
jgi:hypothetical protein